MQLREKVSGGIVVLSLKGNLICEPDALKIRERIYDLVAHQIKSVVIDLRAVEHINSCGIGLLVSVLTTLRKANGDLRLARVSEHVQRLLELTHLTQILNAFGTVEDAVKSFNINKG